MPSVSLAAVGTRVDSANRASASRLSIFTGSSNHAGSYSSSARAMRIALGRFQSECSSTISSIRSPTASRTLRNGSMPLRRSSSEIDWPPLASAYGSRGQIFMPVMPCSSRLSRERPRVGQEPVEVLVRPGRGRLGVPVRDRQPGRLRHAADVAVAGARVVGADPVARGAAEQLVDRLAADLAEQVPERDVDRGAAAVLDARRR